jgi:TctA family transporter
MALMLGALMIQGIPPGPQILTQHPDLFWGLVASMWIGNLMLLVLNLPLVGIWIRLLTIPYRLLYPVILVLCCVGVYSIANSAFFIAVAAVMGAVGYVFRRLDCPPAPLLLGLVLGPVLEENLRRALLISRGNPWVFVQRPISAGLLALAVVLVVVFSLPALRGRERGSVRG